MAGSRKSKPKRKEWQHSPQGSVEMKNTWLSFGVPPATKARLVKLAEVRQVPVSQLLREAVESLLDE